MTLLTVAALQLQLVHKGHNPGAGIGVTGPGGVVNKDGFMAVECLTDSMYEDADKYGENRELYSNQFNVSIVRYADVVDREKARKITPQVCFDFCRTIHDMHFFGLVHGRDCYCTPYYERKTSGGGVCDLPCEGDSAVMCGGKEMMNLYEMHMCANTAEDLDAAGTAGLAKQSQSLGAGTWGKTAAGIFEEAADALMLEANTVGDMSSHDLAQEMKVHAGTVLHAAEAAEASGTKLKEALALMHGLKNNDFSVASNIYEAEEAIRTVTKLSEKAEEDGAHSEAINAKFYPHIDVAHAQEGAGLFVSVMDLIHRWQEVHVENLTHAVAYPTTCEGEFAADPIVGLSVEECAEACNVLAPQSADNYCIAFQHFQLGDIDLHPAGTSGGDTGCADFLGKDYYYYNGCESYVRRTYYWHAYSHYYADYCDENGYRSAEGCDYYRTWATEAYGDRTTEPEEHTCGTTTESRRRTYNTGWVFEDDDATAQDFPEGATVRDACCGCGGGKSAQAPRPNTGLCVLFKSLDHVYKYDCGETGECTDTDYTEFLNPSYSTGYGDSASVCKQMAEYPNQAAGKVAHYYYDGNPGCFHYYFGLTDEAPPLKEGCCSVKALYPDGKFTPSGGKKKLLVQRGATGKLGKALLGKAKGSKRRKYRSAETEEKYQKSEALAQVSKKKGGPGHAHVLTAPPPGLTTANHCKVRATWMIAGPQKPAYEALNTCLDTGALVMPSKK